MGFAGLQGIFPGADFAILDMQSGMDDIPAWPVAAVALAKPPIGIADAETAPLRNTPNASARTAIFRARLQNMAGNLCLCLVIFKHRSRM
jgi:hypothetical protein